ncbi:MAG: formylglycine-generating enzyme family protein [Planctomycetia bacterium]|nr:formylglycine-generating enzyme family protein [Planctomycetia bacterium]
MLRNGLLVSAFGIFVVSLLIGGTVNQPALAKEPPQETIDLLKTFNAEFVAITPGEKAFPKSFVMGTEKGAPAEAPAHSVTFGYSFAMAKYEVPQNLYEAVMGENPSKWKGPRNSVEMFDFDEALTFCKKATALMRDAKLLAADEEIRLPTEAEWEYCCRAGTTTAYSFGDSAVKPDDAGTKASILDEFAWHTGNAAGNDPPVGAKKPNAWGLYDMHGYLWEFVSDAWYENYEGAPADGRSRTDDNKPARRVIRGGSWKDRHEALRSAHRKPIAEKAKDDDVGLRCVKAKVK